MTSFDATSEMVPYSVLGRYAGFESIGRIEVLRNHNGLSGAEIFRVAHPVTADWFCLRRWPNAMQDERQLRAIHATLNAAVRDGLDVVPAPLPTMQGATIVREDDVYWELAPWMPGTADYHTNPSTARFENALTTLARFHTAVCKPTQRQGQVPGILDRLQITEYWLGQDLAVLRGKIESEPSCPYQDQFQRILDAFAAHGEGLRCRLIDASQWSLPLQACIRDVRAEHVLFEGHRVSGLVDFGAMRNDHIGLDLARLLGSLAGDSDESWLNGVAYYEQGGRKFGKLETQLVGLIDVSNVLLSGLNWVRWLVLEHRGFHSASAVATRIGEIARRVQRLDGTHPLSRS